MFICDTCRSLPYKSSTGSSPSFALFTLVRATSTVLHVASSVFNFNHLSRVSLKHATLCRGLSLAVTLSISRSNPNSIPMSSQSLAYFLVTYLLRSLNVGLSFSVSKHCLCYNRTQQLKCTVTHYLESDQ